MSAAAEPAPSPLAVFRRRDFRLLWLAQLVSTAGSALTDIAAAIYVYRETGSALAVGLTLMATAVPSLVVGLLAGVFVDRHDRKRIMVVTCLVQAVIVSVIAFVIGIDAIALPGLYALLLLNAGVKQFFDPAHDSLIPEMASDEELAAANSFLSIAAFGSTAIGFAAAGLLASTVDLFWAFIIDAATFVVSAAFIARMGRYDMPVPEEEASVSVIAANLKSGISTLFGTPVIRSLFVVGALMFFSFGLWNVLLLPFSIEVLGATEFEYGLQEGLTSVGFVAGSLFMARFASKLPEPAWVVVAMVGMGVAGIFYALATSVPVAILLVTVTGFFNSPASVARSVLLQRNTPREMRGRVFSAFYVLRDVIFLFGMAGAGIADLVDIRLLIVVASSLLLVSAVFTLVAPGIGVATWRAASARLRAAATAPALAGVPVRAATTGDFDRLAVRLGTFGLLTPEQRGEFLRDAVVSDVPAGTRIVEHGEAASTAHFILDGAATAGIPEEGGYRGLSTMGAGDFFGEIAALTGSPRTADVVADSDTTLLTVPAEALRATLTVPEIRRLVLSTLATRLTRTESADLPRLAGLDHEALRELRTPRPEAEALPRSYAESS
ncbi:MAG TPA: MFS transporter [Candidatus Limnocylindrales bacterium]|nr:MFS transporter [Candidatus Limnocylindrales bacterium]